MNEQSKPHLFSRTPVMVAIATLCCALWGSAPPCIKLGYQLLQIEPNQTMNIILFAGCRFALAGFLVILAYSVMQRKPMIPQKASWKPILCLSMAQTFLQYLLYYVGTANTTGVKASILSGSGAFCSVLVACLIFRQEKMTANKLVGCIAGLLGMVLVTLQGNINELSGGISLIGEGCIMISAISSACSSSLVRIFSQKHNAVMLSGYQFFIGGLTLIFVALIGGGTLPNVTPAGLIIILYLSLVSAFAYTLWSLLLKHHPVSRVSVFNFLIPVFGVTITGILLKEGGIFSMTTIFSLVLVCSGILLVNRTNSKA